MVKVIAEEDREIFTDSNGNATLTRVIQFEADSLDEIATSNLVPQWRSRHPKLSNFYLSTGRTVKNGNKNRGVQALATLSYVNSSSSVNFITGVDPWDLGALNFHISYITMPQPLLWGYTREGEAILNLNSAGTRILAESTEYIPVLNFTYCIKAKSSSEPIVNRKPIVNKNAVTVAGIPIAPMWGKLMPLSATLIQEYNSSGTRVQRSYWEYSAQIQLREDYAAEGQPLSDFVKNGWGLVELDVGTLCRFKGPDGALIEQAQSIYRYTPWKSKEDMKKNIPPKYGSLDDVIRAREEFAGSSGLDRQTALSNFPYEEVTEPMPLKKDGTLYEEAIADPKSYPYNKIEIFDCEIGSWNAYNLPRKRA